MKNLFNVSLTSDDYRYYQNAKDAFAINNYISFIQENSASLEIGAELDEDVHLLDKHREEIGKFYQYAFKRDGAFLRNMKFSPLGIKNSQKAAILVSGGFHADPHRPNPGSPRPSRS